MFDLGAPGEEEAVAELADSAQVCNCNGVSKGALVAAVKGGCTSVSAAMDATRAGKGCGSCKLMISQVVEWAAGGGAVEEDPAASYYVPGIPLDKPALMAEIRARGGCGPFPRCLPLSPPGRLEDAKSKMALASLMKMMLADQYVDERDARFINDRVHANIQRDGTFSVVPQMKGGGDVGAATPEDCRRR